MNKFFTRFYAMLLIFYPREFRADFGDEMKAVFTETITSEQEIKSAIIFLHELFDLPGSILSIYLQSWFRGGNMSTQNEYIVPSTRWQALIGTLPFLAFGFSSMIGKVDEPFFIHSHDAEMAVYGLSLVGLLIGWICGFPLWSYSYLGWSVLLAYFNTNWGYYGNQPDFQVWIPFGLMVLFAVLWTRSLAPIKKLLRDSWNDWTRLSLAMFTFGGFAGMIYDENHHPLLLWFMFASTLAISAGVWFFLRSSSLKGRVFFILVSFVAGVLISWVCDATWDFHAYHGLIPQPTTWYREAWKTTAILSFWVAILFWPALIAVLHRITSVRTTSSGQS